MAKGSRVIKPDVFADAVGEVLQEIGEEATKTLFDAVDEAVEACNETAKQYLSKGHGIKTGNYRNHFAIDKYDKTKHRHVATWYVEEPEYRLTHLLENGHATRDGTKRTKAIKHIKHGREIAEQVLDERLNSLWQ